MINLKLSLFGENPKNVKKNIITLKDDYVILQKNYEILQEEGKQKEIISESTETKKANSTGKKAEGNNYS